MAPNYIYAFDLTAWGWIHLLIGLALVAIGICLVLGQGWAQVAGIVVAAISALINFTWLPYSPLWAILVIAVDLSSSGHWPQPGRRPRPPPPPGRWVQRSADVEDLHRVDVDQAPVLDAIGGGHAGISSELVGVRRYSHTPIWPTLIREAGESD